MDEFKLSEKLSEKLSDNEYVQYLAGLVYRDHGRQPKDISNDGSIRYQCPECGSWWYGKQEFCHKCGQRIKYTED